MSFNSICKVGDAVLVCRGLRQTQRLPAVHLQLIGQLQRIDAGRIFDSLIHEFINAEIEGVIQGGLLDQFIDADQLVRIVWRIPRCRAWRPRWLGRTTRAGWRSSRPVSRP